jgi:hypothetical protein
MTGMGHSSKETHAQIRDRIRAERIKDDMGFSLRWQWELACSDAPTSQKLAGMMLRLFGDADGSNNAPSLPTLSAVTGLAESTLKVALGGLEKEFLKKTDGAGRRANSYQLVVPERTLRELAAALDARSEPTTGSLTNCNKPVTGSQSASVVSRSPADKAVVSRTNHRSEPTTGSNLDRPRSLFKSERATRLPSDWKPSPEDRAYAAGEGLSDFQIDRVGDDFRDYWLSGNAKGKGLKVDWPQTWRTWVRRVDRDKLPTQKRHANGSGASRLDGDVPEFVRAAEESARKAKAAGARP